MAEWSKAVDLSPTISGCAGSNPAWYKFLYYVCIFTASIAQLVERAPCKRKVGGSTLSGGVIALFCPRSSVGRAPGF